MTYQIGTFIALIALASITESKIHNRREAPTDICNIVSNTSKIQCFCIRDRTDEVVRNADCYLTSLDIQDNDSNWDIFESIKTVTKIIFSAARGINLKYIPTNAVKHLKDVERIDIKYGHIHEIKPYAFANLSQVDQIALSDNKIVILHKHAFAHHHELTEIILDRNQIVEINRDVFFDLPSLNKLFMTTNNITTIHDKAFQHLTTLQELDLDKNNIFSLNSETFAGLKNLLRLQLDGNSLEVIGDNTFLPLVNLQYLDLQDNKIQMLDEKAFRGLWKLQSLSLNRNKLKTIDNVKVFESLRSLRSLSLKDNKLVELKAELFAPIINNFNGPSGMIDFEENNFPCDCRLDWFVLLKNKTENENLKLALDNLKCYPDEQLSEKWKKILEAEPKPTTEIDSLPAKDGQEDYEYYDESQLNGKLFYIDIRHLLNCTKTSSPHKTAKAPSINQLPEPKIVSNKIEPPPKEEKHTHPPKAKPEGAFNRGVLDLSLDETTVKEDTKDSKDVQNLKEVERKHTTSRVATVSPKPFKNTKYEDKEMASDEAASDKFLAHQRKEEYIKEETKYESSAYRSNACILLFIPLMLNL